MTPSLRAAAAPPPATLGEMADMVSNKYDTYVEKHS